MKNIFDKLIKIGDVFQNKVGDKLTLVNINHDKPESFVYEFKVNELNVSVYSSVSDIILYLERI